ncbi:hypothetical protein HUJ05_004164 [Dendroctonus ponderosae]|nr:hypothetical protein HUJ05_004164 [Dendroctonus ponderosae]
MSKTTGERFRSLFYALDGEFRKVCAKAVRRYRIRENKQPRTEQHKVHHPMASMSTVRLTKGDSPNWGFRLQGGKDFGTPLVIQKMYQNPQRYREFLNTASS